MEMRVTDGSCPPGRHPKFGLCGRSPLIDRPRKSTCAFRLSSKDSPPIVILVFSSLARVIRDTSLAPIFLSEKAPLRLVHSEDGAEDHFQRLCSAAVDRAIRRILRRD